MTTVERAGEILVRRLDRRSFLRKSATAAFGFTAAAAVQGIFPSRAFANACQETSGYTVCHPPGYPNSPRWCTDLGYTCNGGDCNTPQCSYNKQTYISTGCWCTQKSCGNCGSPNAYCGYYHCCDCNCPPNATLACGCKGFIYTCRQSASASPDFQCCT